MRFAIAAYTYIMYSHLSRSLVIILSCSHREMFVRVYKRLGTESLSPGYRMNMENAVSSPFAYAAYAAFGAYGTCLHV